MLDFYFYFYDKVVLMCINHNLRKLFAIFSLRVFFCVNHCHSPHFKNVICHIGLKKLISINDKEIE